MRRAQMSRSELPTGTVTFLFTDIEGSTQLLQRLGNERYVEELLRHRERIREVVRAHRGVEFGTEGDAFFVAFDRAEDALGAAEGIQSALAAGPIRVRAGIHTGEVLVADGDYVGLEVHKAARICAAAHGGQVLVSERTRAIAGAVLDDLGEHRLKDLAAPERLFQLGEGRFPPPRTLYRASLPVQPTPLLGRAAELAELIAIAPAYRLVTLTGPGGTGKTRLALALAAELAERYRDGVWWVPLAPVSDPALVIPTIALTLAAGDDLPGYLGDRQLLLVLDNFEQVLDAATAIADLLAAAPNVRVIATSRERLGLAAEQEFPVPPLTDTEAVELFTARARQVNPAFEPRGDVLAICRRLDCLPLALELAATRAKVLSAEQILARLEQRLGLLTGKRRDVPERQTTMRAAIDWSYELLSDTEQCTFRALGVFAGSFELAAAESVCEATIDELQSLADKSLIRQRADGRFFMLETTHEYALERLQAAGETDELGARHASWFLNLAAAAKARQDTPEQDRWLERLRADVDNFRAVLAWTQRHDLRRGLELAAALFRPWRMSGQLNELIAWFEPVVAELENVSPSERAAALMTFGDALMYVEDYVRAENVLDESLALARAHTDRLREASALNSLGSVRSGIGARSDALRLHEQALAIYQQRGEPAGISRSLHLLAENLRDIGSLDRAASMLEEAVAIDTERGDRHAAMTSRHSLGDVALDQNDPRAAAAHYREALAICVEQQDQRSQAYCLAGLASAAALEGEPHTAGRLWAAAEMIEARIGLRMLATERRRYERLIAVVHGDAAFESGRAGSSDVEPERLAKELLSSDERASTTARGPKKA
jgi:predicted ATPase/class 3 adenylate cyclase